MVAMAFGGCKGYTNYMDDKKQSLSNKKETLTYMTLKKKKKPARPWTLHAKNTLGCQIDCVKKRFPKVNRLPLNE